MAVASEVPEDDVDCEKRRGRRATGQSGIAAPLPRLRTHAHACPHRVEREVPQHLQRVGIGLDESRVISTLEAMSCLTMPAIETLCVAGIQVLHPSSEIRVRCSDEKVVMRGHETEAMTHPVQPGDDFGKKFQKPPAVVVVTEQGLASDAAGRDVEGPAGDLKARPSRHRSTLDHRLGRQSERASLVTESHLFLGGV